MLEVLDEVYVSSIPLFYFTDCELQLYPHVLLKPKRCLAFVIVKLWLSKGLVIDVHVCCTIVLNAVHD